MRSGATAAVRYQIAVDRRDEAPTRREFIRPRYLTVSIDTMPTSSRKALRGENYDAL